MRATAAVVTAAIMAAAACGVGSEGDSSEDGGPGTTAAAPGPGGGSGGGSGAAIDIDAAVEAAREENTLVVYGNPSADQWTPVLEAFGEAYPGIEVETFDLGGTEAFQRYLSEEATGAATADVIISHDGAGWLDLVERGQVVDYVDPELAGMPEEAVLAPGVFAMSYDPVVALFNSEALPADEQPASLAELADMAEDLDGRIGTVAIENSNAGLGTFGYVDAHGEDAWEVLERLGPHARAEDGTGPLLGKIQSGEYVAAFFVGGATRALVDTTDAGDILDWRYFEDATALPGRGMAVTAAADSPNAARVLLHFLLSAEGQEAGCAGGFTPYRDDVDCPADLAAIEDEVGEGNAILVGYPEDLAERQEAIRERWNTAFGR
jgi:iron(III) transport system substrate-binding protein